MTTKDRPRVSHKSEVHRVLHITSPLLKGPDVKALQQQLNYQAKHYGFTWRQIQEDGQYGIRTWRQAKLVAWLMGLEDDSIPKRGTLNKHVQTVLRNPEKRSDADRRREDERKPKRVKIKKQREQGAQAVTRFLMKHKGVNESPANSNHGPFPIDECQQFFGLAGVPWCGCLAGYAIIEVADNKTVDDIWWPYAGSIRVAAQSGSNGMHDINPANAFEGCVATFFNGGDDHVAWVYGVDVRRRVLLTLEGNTSSATRDADGGIIEAKERSFDEVSCVAAIEDWS